MELYHIFDRLTGLHDRTTGKLRSDTPGSKKLVYVCHPFNLCGGHGDRTNGMLMAFLLGLFTERTVYFDADNPLPLQMLLQPAEHDWRIAHTAELASLTSAGYYQLDERWLHRDFELLLNEPAETILVQVNLREFPSILNFPFQTFQDGKFAHLQGIADKLRQHDYL